MNQYITGAVIRELRESSGLTQAELAEKLCVSDKTVSKWETAKGYPDISLLESLAQVFKVSVAELFSGNAVKNKNISANMIRSKFYVCPVCGNCIHAMGESVIHCHGVLLAPCQPEEPDENHRITVKQIEDEYFVHVQHDMGKAHHISFLAALSSDKIQMVKLYPEGNAEASFKMNGVRQILFYCNRDGLFCLDVRKPQGNHRLDEGME